MEDIRVNYFRGAVGNALTCKGCGSILDYRSSAWVSVDAEKDNSGAMAPVLSQVICFACVGMEDAEKIAGKLLARLTANQPGVRIKIDVDTATGSAVVEGCNYGEGGAS